MSWINIHLKKYRPHQISNGLVLQMRKPRPDMLGRGADGSGGAPSYLSVTPWAPGTVSNTLQLKKVLLGNKTAVVSSPIASLLPVAWIKTHKVVSVGIQPYWHCHTDPFSCLGQCNSRSVSLRCRHHGKAAQPGTRDFIPWPRFLYPENERIPKRWSLKSLPA